jgi:hypothetical protein
MSNLLSKSQLQKLRDAAALANLAAIEVDQHAAGEGFDADPTEADAILDFFTDAMVPKISELDALIGKADQL